MLASVMTWTSVNPAFLAAAARLRLAVCDLNRATMACSIWSGVVCGLNE